MPVIAMLTGNASPGDARRGFSWPNATRRLRVLLPWRGQGFLFIHRKTFKARPRALDVTKYRLRRTNWFTPRTAVLVEKYALTEEEVTALLSIFSVTDFKVCLPGGNFAGAPSVRSRTETSRQRYRNEPPFAEINRYCRRTERVRSRRRGSALLGRRDRASRDQSRARPRPRAAYHPKGHDH